MTLISREFRIANWINGPQFSESERDILWSAKRIIDEKEARRKSFRKVARHHGLKAAATLRCGFHPITGTIDDRSMGLAVREARFAARHALAAMEGAA